jgi:hypothetical protein
MPKAVGETEFAEVGAVMLRGRKKIGTVTPTATLCWHAGAQLFQFTVTVIDLPVFKLARPAQAELHCSCQIQDTFLILTVTTAPFCITVMVKCTIAENLTHARLGATAYTTL